MRRTRSTAAAREARVARGARVVGGALAVVLVGGVLTVATGAADGPDRGPGGDAADGSASADELASGPVTEERLEARLLDPGEPYVALDDAESGLGTLDAPAVLALSGSGVVDAEDALAGLEALGFERARGRAWQAPGAAYVVLVYGFAAPEGATGLVEGLRAALPGEPFTSPSAPGAAAWTSGAPGASEQHVAFARGRYVYELTLVTTEPDPDHTRFEPLVAAQVARAGQVG